MTTTAKHHEIDLIMNHPWLPALLLFLLAAVPLSAGEKIPQSPPASAKCPVCGMFVAKYPDWTGVIVFKDSSSFFFDGPKDLFKYYFAMEQYTPDRDRSKVDTFLVKDYYTLTLIDGGKAFYVMGSDVFGPMGRELVPFSSAEDAAAFFKDHGGKRILRFKEITPEILKTLD
jgi:copper chaperone NosL